MAEPEFLDLKFVGRQVPDSSVETDANGHKFLVELPGMFEVGLMYKGVFRAIHSFKAAGFLADVERVAKAEGASPPPTDG